MEIIPIKTEKVNPPQDDLPAKIKQALPRLREGDCVAVTSKVVSIWQGSCVPQRDADKYTLAKEEADFYFGRHVAAGDFLLTIKNNVLIASAGIDASNANGYFILWPRNPDSAAQHLLGWFKKTYRKKRLGIIITDSHLVPMRRGVVGVAVAWAGFEPLHDYRGVADLFGRKLRVSQANLPDALAAAAVLVMGEGGEQTPVVIIRNIPRIRFTSQKKGGYGRAGQRRHNSFNIPLKEDLYAPFLANTMWRKGGGSFFRKTGKNV